MKAKIKVGAVSYLNTKPLLYGIARSPIASDIELTLQYPALLAQQLSEGELDLALLPVAAIPQIPHAAMVGNYGIAAEGNVVSVALFSRVPLEQVDTIILDYQSRTSVRLAQLLLHHHWHQKVAYLPATTDYINHIVGRTAGVIIGDRALEQLKNFKYIYDLSAAWKSYCGLDFVFAAWVSNKSLPAYFVAAFNEANRIGLEHIDEIVRDTYFPAYDLKTYYTVNIKYLLDEPKTTGLSKFLTMIQER